MRKDCYTSVLGHFILPPVVLTFQSFIFSIEDQPKEPAEQAHEEAPRKMRERPTSARPAKRVKAPVVEEIAPPAVVNPNGRFLGFLVLNFSNLFQLSLTKMTMMKMKMILVSTNR